MTSFGSGSVPRRPFSTMATQLCSDNVKFILMNAVQHCHAQERETFFRHRKKLYQRLPSLVQANRTSATQADNLYVICYSQLYTMREMVRDRHGDREVHSLDDETIKADFRDMLLSLPACLTVDQFDTAFMKVVRKHVPAERLEEYQQINNWIVGKPARHMEHNKEAFIDGSAETNIYLRKKLVADIAKFYTPMERVANFLNKYQFLNGWITSAGILGLASSSKTPPSGAPGGRGGPGSVP